MLVRKTRVGVFLVMAAFTLSASLSAQPVNIKKIIKREAPGVVAIFNLDGEGDLQASGSGFIVSPDGILITNFHVIEGAAELLVKTMTGEVFDRVAVIDFDPRRDIAVLKMQAIGLPTVTLSNTDEEFGQGDWCLAIGNPAGLENTVSDGIVSAVRISQGTQVIQITAPISPGSSGGPLFNSRGEVVGITTAMLSGENNQNLNFAVPLKYALPMMGSDTLYTLAEVAERGTPTGQLGTPAAARNTYTDPNGFLTVTVPSGWQIGPTSGIRAGVFTSRNGTSNFLCNFITGVSDLESNYEKYKTGALSAVDGVKEKTGRSHLRMGNLPAIVEIVEGTGDGIPIQVFLGAMLTANGAAFCVGITPIEEPYHPDHEAMYDMFFSLR